MSTQVFGTHVCRSDIREQVLSIDRARMLAETFKVLGDPTRVRMVHALSLSELCTSDLAEVVSMSESAVSHQLRTLRQLRVVRSRREGKLVFYSLDDDHIRRLFEQGFEHTLEKARAGDS
ncbi:MAG TPA: metalloregulator ArsR/SmtB family transcription factor [Vicinamibacteria bacterium]|nr:metalloregulator ArsR/SmtB family transcription factor [Vicinamibacteria bacterium]